MARRDRQKKLGRNGNGIGTPLPVAIALLPTPLASDSAPEEAGQVGGTRPSGAKRQTGLPEVIVHGLASQSGPAGTAEPGEGRLLPTPDTGCSPNGHGRRGGRPGNGHQSGHGLDVTATALSPEPGPRAGQGRVAWGEYEPAIRRWEHLLGCPAPPPAEPGPSGRPRLSAAFAEWMMSLSIGSSGAKRRMVLCFRWWRGQAGDVVRATGVVHCVFTHRRRGLAAGWPL
jgi:hypothetical protein